MNRSLDISAISKALVAAQAEMKNPVFDTTNPHFRNRFASLAAIRNAVVPILNKHGIAMTQDLTNADGLMACTTTLTHESGQYLEFGPLAMPATKQDAQGFGSAATYCKRYALQSVCGVVGDDDDDGNAASKKLNDTRDGLDIEGQDPAKIADYVKRLTAGLQNADNEAIYTVQDELHGNADLYTAIWGKLSSKFRTDLRAIISARPKQ